jgi:hypothetical protein
MSTDPHHAEYAAAAAGIHDQTPRGCRLPAVGDWVSGCSGRKPWQGRVQQAEPGRIVVEIDGAWLVVSEEDITE